MKGLSEMPKKKPQQNNKRNKQRREFEEAHDSAFVLVLICPRAVQGSQAGLAGQCISNYVTQNAEGHENLHENAQIPTPN